VRTFTNMCRARRLLGKTNRGSYRDNDLVNLENRASRLVGRSPPLTRAPAQQRLRDYPRQSRKRAGLPDSLAQRNMRSLPALCCRLRRAGGPVRKLCQTIKILSSPATRMASARYWPDDLPPSYLTVSRRSASFAPGSSRKTRLMDDRFRPGAERTHGQVRDGCNPGSLSAALSGRCHE